MAADYSRIHRLLKMIMLFQSGEQWDIRRLVDHFEVVQRTVYRDLAILQDLGIPHYFDPESKGYRIRRDFFMPPLDLTLEESLALVALGEHISGREQIPMVAAAARAISKVRSQLPASIQDEVAELEPHLHIDLAKAGPHDGFDDIYQKVRSALTDRRVLECRYQSIDKSLQDGVAEEPAFEFRPYALFFCQRAWYAVGHHGGRNEVRTLKLNRFGATTVTDRPYMIPNEFALRKHLGNAWRMIRGTDTHKVELRFEPGFAETVAETHWHPTQEVTWNDDGSIIFACTVDGLDEIQWWVLSMGPSCTVIKPPELINRVETLAGQIVDRYTEPPAAQAAH